MYQPAFTGTPSHAGANLPRVSGDVSPRSDGTQASKTFRTKTEARQFKANIDADRSRGALPDGRQTKLTFAQYSAQYIVTLDHRESTARRRDGIMKKYLLPSIGHVRMTQIRHIDLQKEVGKWQKAGLSPRSILNHIHCLKPIFDSAVREDIIMKNPVMGLKLPKPGKVERHPLDPQECHALLQAIPQGYVPLIHFALATGVRWNELASIKIGDLNMLRKEVTIRESKTDAGIRTLPLDSEDIAHIAKHLADSGRTGADDESPLFTSPEGMPLHYSNFRRRVFLLACEKAGIPDVTFHDLRRSHATMLVAEGHDVKVVQERMGHRSITTTLAHYAIATEKGRVGAAGAKNRYLGGVSLKPLSQAN